MSSRNGLSQSTGRGDVAYWLLIGAFLLTTALNLLHVRGGFLTSHLADLTVPPLLYVISRGLAPNRRRSFVPLMQWLGRTPERAALFLFLASSATELTQVFWPRGFFAGRYDPWDIVAYGGSSRQSDGRPGPRPAVDSRRPWAGSHHDTHRGVG